MEEETFIFRCPTCFDQAKRKEVCEYQIAASFANFIGSRMPDIFLSRHSTPLYPDLDTGEVRMESTTSGK